MSAGQEAALYIRRLVFDGTLPPGTRIPQSEVAAALGISRIPIREALIALEREGVVTIVPHRGAYVAAFDEDGVRDHYELFGLVYGFAAQRTAERATPEVVAQLVEHHRAVTSATAPEDVLRHTYEWNRVVLDVGGSPRLRALLGTLTGLVPGNFFAVPGTVATQHEGLDRILEAIRASDGPVAFDACREMMRAHGRSVIALLAERGLFRTTG